MLVGMPNNLPSEIEKCFIAVGLNDMAGK